MLKSLYTINTIKEEDGLLSAFVSLNEQSVIYEAHFPSDPITPGVCQVHLIQDVLSRNYPNQVFKLRKAKQLKFTGVLRPNENKEIVLEMEITRTEHEWNVNAQISNDTKSFLKAKLSYAVD